MALKQLELTYTEPVAAATEADAMQVDEENKPKPAEKRLPVIVYATSRSIKLLSAKMEQDGFGGGTVYSEMRCPDESSKFTAVKFADESSSRLLIAQQGGVLKHMEVCLSEDKQSASLKEISSMKFASEISSICLSKTCGLELAYLSLHDAPYYSFNIISLTTETMSIVARMPISAVLELAQMKKFC